MDVFVSERARVLTPSLTLSISARAKEMRGEGLDVVGLGAGEPDFDTPEHIKAAAVEGLRRGFTKYTASSGLLELREAIAEKFRRENGLEYSASQVVVSCGGKHSCFNAMMAVCDPGDEVVIPSPYWVSYPEMARLVGAVPVVLPTSEETGFRVLPGQLEGAITERTRMFVLNSPSNPTGTVYEGEEVRALGEVCARRGVYVLSDEIYERLVYGGVVHRSVGSFSREIYDRTIVVHGFAKGWSMTGWRLGFLAAPEGVAAAVGAVQSHSTSNATSFAQLGGLAALQGSQDHLDEWLGEFDRRRRLALDFLGSMDGVSCVEPFGAFYLFPNVGGTGLRSGEFCERLLGERYVALVPGAAFGADDCVRLSYATDLESLEKGLERMAGFVKGLV